MRRSFFAGNWKMNLLPQQAAELAAQIAGVAGDTDAEVALCVPFVDIPAAAQALAGTAVALGAQNVHWAESGAFTGEVSPEMLSALGVKYVIIGHSERRQYFGETDETVNQRIKGALRAGLSPIVCVGETLSQQEAGETAQVVEKQTTLALQELTPAQARCITVAYEPIWAIGTGKTATPEQANATIAVIRKTLQELYGEEIAQTMRILYGGSMNGKNAAGLMAMPEIDGGLIGGASLKADTFAALWQNN